MRTTVVAVSSTLVTPSISSGARLGAVGVTAMVGVPSAARSMAGRKAEAECERSTESANVSVRPKGGQRETESASTTSSQSRARPIRVLVVQRRCWLPDDGRRYRRVTTPLNAPARAN